MLPVPPEPHPALLFTNGILDDDHAKTGHGVLRGSRRFRAVAVIDHTHAGRDAGEVMDGKPLGVPIFASVEAFQAAGNVLPTYFLIGVGFAGGKLPASARPAIADALSRGLTVVNGLHQLLGDDPEFRAIAEANGGGFLDIRRPRPVSELRFWTGDVRDVKAKAIAVLGTDCAIGKRTTAKFLAEACNAAGLKAEMIYTGQTGWMQGHKHGFIFDTTVNDFIGGEIERALLECDRESKPDVMFIEGQSALRNPSGPCGSEFILSGNARAVILQHAPSRTHFISHDPPEAEVPTPEQEIPLIEAYGARVLAVTINESGKDRAWLDAYRDDLQRRLGIPVVFPLRGETERLVPVVRAYLGGG